MYTRLDFVMGVLLHHSKLAKPRPPETRGDSKESSHHGA
jgi:hypothetical protein